MKSNYSGLWLMLSVALAAVLAVASSDDVTVGSWTLRKAPVPDLFADADGHADTVGHNPLQVEGVVPNVFEDPVVETDTVPKSIFLFGDSMTFNIALRMARYAKQNGHMFHAVNWDSSNTRIWAECDTLAHCLDRYHADYVFISLGSNEVYFKKPESRLPYIRAILRVIGERPYVWIGPPNWNEDTGINDILAAECRPGSFFRSQGMKFKRKADKIHPTREASALWVDSIMSWLPSSSHPILADIPSDSLGKVNPHVVFLKALNK